MSLKKSKRKKHILDPNVNITALMDVLTVLLFFLIKSFSVSSAALRPPDGIRLPASLVQAPAKEAVTLSITKNEILANNKVVLKLNQGKFRTLDIGKDDRTLIPLQNYLDTQMKKRNAIYAGAGDLSFLPPAELLIQADRKLPFGVLKYLLHTAAVTGYSDYQFIVVNKQSGQ